MTTHPADPDAPTELLAVVDHRLAWWPALLAFAVLAVVAGVALIGACWHLALLWGAR